MRKLLIALLGIVALASLVSCECSDNFIEEYFFNNDLAVGPASGIFNTLSALKKQLKKFSVSNLLCRLFGIKCPPKVCSTIHPMTNLDQNNVNSFSLSLLFLPS